MIFKSAERYGTLIQCPRAHSPTPPLSSLMSRWHGALPCITNHSGAFEGPRDVESEQVETWRDRSGVSLVASWDPTVPRIREIRCARSVLSWNGTAFCGCLGAGGQGRQSALVASHLSIPL
jgi:hypothetical protein